MARYEYKVVVLKVSMWWGAGSAHQDALLEMLNREGRGGWRMVSTHRPGLIPWNNVLLERVAD